MIKYRLLVYLTSFTVFSGDIKKKSEKKLWKWPVTSSGHFQSFFFHPEIWKKSCKSINEKNLAL